MILFFVQSIFAKPQCSEPFSKDDFVQDLDSIELDFVKADLPSIEDKLNLLQQNIPCLSQRLLPENAARYHILNGLKSWIADDEPQAKRSFAVAKRTDPNANISTHIFPKEHFIHQLYSEVPPADYTNVKTSPSIGSYSFDGYLIPRRPQKAPTIMQIVDDNKIHTSAYLKTDAPLPIWNYKKKRKHHKTIAFGASAVAMIIGVRFQLEAQNMRQQYIDIVDDMPPLDNIPHEQRFIHANDLKLKYDSHVKLYQQSFAALGLGSTILGLSYFLEW